MSSESCMQDVDVVDAVGLQSLHPAYAERDQAGALSLEGVSWALRRRHGGPGCTRFLAVFGSSTRSVDVHQYVPHR